VRAVGISVLDDGYFARRAVADAFGNAGATWEVTPGGREVI
jgi:hypothetical protein